MTISIVVHLQAKSALHTRHLLRSLEAQQGVDTEILLFCSSDINQLPKLPESWKTHQLEPNTSSFDVWT